MIMAFHTTLLMPQRFNAYLRLTRARAGRSSALSSAIAPAAISSKSGRSGARSRCGAMPMSPNGPSGAPSWLRIPAGRCFAPRKRKSIGSEFERLFKPAPFMPVKNFTSADEFVEMRVCRSHTGVLNRFLEIYAAEGLPVQLRHLGNCIGYFRSVDGRVDEVLHLWGYADLNDRIKRRAALFADPAFKAFLVKGVPHFSRQDNFNLRPNSFWRP
jgi:hypothetical protein